MRTALAILGAALAIPAPGWAKTFEWNEEVTLASGEVVRVARMESRGDLPASLPGGQSMRSQSLAFDHRGKRVAWKADTGSWPMYIMPRAFEIVDGEPVLVFDVWGYEGCTRFDYPQDSIGALRYRNGTWSPMPRAQIPAGVRVNLLHEGAYAWGRHPEYKGMLVDARLRKHLEGGSRAPATGATLEELSRHHATAIYDDTACRVLRRAPDPAVDAANARLEEALRTAPAADDEARHEIAAPGSRSDERWTGRVWLTSDCRGVIEKVEPVAQATGDGRSHTIHYNGVALLLVDKTRLARVELMDRQLAVQRVSCEGGNIAILGRRDKSNSVLLRLKADGTLRDAKRIVPPETDGRAPTPIPGGSK